MAVNYETLYPNNTYVGVRLDGTTFGFDDDPLSHFALCDRAPGSRVYYERASIND